MSDKKNKSNFKKKKDLTISSLNEVNNFLIKLNKNKKTIKLIKLIK